MRFATSFEHRYFFSKNGFIEFEKLISLSECALLQTLPAERDLWRKHHLVKKISLRCEFGEIATSLLKQKILRIGFDQKVGSDQEVELLNSSVKPIIALSLFLSGEKAGGGLFFLPEAGVPPLVDTFLITYCPEKTQYLYNPKDPHTHSLKKLQYTFGDLIKNNTHPLLTK